MPVFKITEARTVWYVYEIEAESAEAAVENYEDGEVVDEDLNTQTEVIAVEDEDGRPVGKWVLWNSGMGQDRGYPHYEDALGSAGYPKWEAPEEDG